jgi:hypothetical protein
MGRQAAAVPPTLYLNRLVDISRNIANCEVNSALVIVPPLPLVAVAGAAAGL